MSAEFNVDELTNAQLDRLQERLTFRVEQRKAEREAAERERRNPTPLRPYIGSGGNNFGNELARRNWDRECIEALSRQTVRFAVAPSSTFIARDGKRLGPGEEIRPTEHINALLGDPLYQLEKLVKQGFVLAKEITL